MMMSTSTTWNFDVLCHSICMVSVNTSWMAPTSMSSIWRPWRVVVKCATFSWPATGGFTTCKSVNTTERNSPWWCVVDVWSVTCLACKKYVLHWNTCTCVTTQWLLVAVGTIELKFLLRYPPSTFGFQTMINATSPAHARYSEIIISERLACFIVPKGTDHFNL